MDALILQILIIALLSGTLYGLIATGLSLVFGIMKIFNLAHGELVLIGAYITFATFPINPVLSFVVSVPFLLLLGVFSRKVLFTSATIKAGTATVIIAFGMSIILQNTLLYIFGADYRGIKSSGWMSEVTRIGDVVIPNSRLTTCIVAIVFISLLALFLKRTALGKDIRATAENFEAAALVGINVGKVQILACGIGFVLAGLAGGLLNIVQVFDPFSGMPLTLKSFTIIVLGGLSVWGSLGGGLVLALTETLAGYFISITYRDVAGFFLLLAVLLLRPKGLFGRRG